MFIGTFCVRDYAFDCRSVRMFYFHSSELCNLEFICFLYKAYDHLRARLWFCGTFMLRLTFLFSVLLSLILCICFHSCSFVYLILFRLID